MENTATGALTRNVDSVSSDLAATTSKTGDTVLQLATIHGDIALQLPLDTSNAPIALDTDEYGNPRAGQIQARYSWLGGKQRSAETLTGLTLMGVRLYNPVTGRFLSVDPVYGGNLNAYEYAHADPINRFDLNGRWSWKSTKRWIKRHRVGIAATAAGVGCGLFTAGLASAGCAVAAGAGTKWYWNRKASFSSIARAGVAGATGIGPFGGVVGSIGRWGIKRAAMRWAVKRYPARGGHRAVSNSHRKKWSWWSSWRR